MNVETQCARYCIIGLRRVIGRKRVVSNGSFIQSSVRGWFTSGSPVVLSGGIHTCCIVGNPPSRTSEAETRRRAPRPNGKRKVRSAILWSIRSRTDVQGDGFQNLSRPCHSTFYRAWQCCSGCEMCVDRHESRVCTLSLWVSSCRWPMLRVVASVPVQAEGLCCPFRVPSSHPNSESHGGSIDVRG